MSELYHVSSSPHVRAKDTTSRIMLYVIIALLPTSIFGIVILSIIGTRRLLKIIAKDTPSAFAPKIRNNPVRIPKRIPYKICPFGVIGDVT